MTIQPSLSLAEIAPKSLQTNRIFTTIFQKLRQLETAEDTLQAGVKILYQALKCDRAVVYSLQANAFCKIVAEAVTPGYAQILGMTIKDPCFEAGYIEKYQKGRVRAIDNIYEADISQCHLENLAKIDIKSNLVVPMIRQDNSLYGLLVMHQCSRTRQWQQSEIELVLEVANWIIEQQAKQQAQIELESQLEHSKQANQLLGSIIQRIHGADTVFEALQQGVERGREVLNCDRVVVYGLQDSSLGKIVAEAADPSLASILGSVIKDPCFEYRYIDRYQQGRIRATPNIFDANMSDCYVENLAKIGVKSNLVAPINWDNGTIYGLLVAHQCFGFKDWQPEEIEHFKQVAFHTGLSLSKSTIKEQLQNLATGFDRLSQVKHRINLAQSKIQQIELPMQHSSKILTEASNLNRLLEREINQIHQSGSAQTKKDLKLTQIIAKKLATITSQLKRSLYTVNAKGSEANSALDKAMVHLDGDL